MGLGRLMFWRRERANAPESWGRDDVMLFRQGGLSLREFARLDQESREAFATVGREYLADIVATLAQAIHDPDFASRLGAKADDGAKRETDVMAAALTAVGVKIHGGRR